MLSIFGLFVVGTFGIVVVAMRIEDVLMPVTILSRLENGEGDIIDGICQLR
jgi:hypothetical protein